MWTYHARILWAGTPCRRPHLPFLIPHAPPPVPCRQAADADKARLESEEHWQRQVSEHQRLAEEFKAAREQSADEAAALRAQLQDVHGQLQVCGRAGKEQTATAKRPLVFCCACASCRAPAAGCGGE